MLCYNVWQCLDMHCTYTCIILKCARMCCLQVCLWVAEVINSQHHVISGEWWSWLKVLRGCSVDQWIQPNCVPLGVILVVLHS